MNICNPPLSPFSKGGDIEPVIKRRRNPLFYDKGAAGRVSVDAYYKEQLPHFFKGGGKGGLLIQIFL
jgi:hypothetical protein